LASVAELHLKAKEPTSIDDVTVLDKLVLKMAVWQPHYVLNRVQHLCVWVFHHVPLHNNNNNTFVECHSAVASATAQCSVFTMLPHNYQFQPCLLTLFCVCLAPAWYPINGFFIL